MPTNYSYNSNNSRGGKRAPKGLLGNPTPAKAAGLTFSLAVVLPLVIAIVFAVAIALSGAKNGEYQKTDWYLYANFLLSQTSFALAALACFFYTKTPVKRAVCSLKCRPKYILLGITMQIGLLCLSELNTLFLRLLGNIGYVSAEIVLPSMDEFGLVGVLFVVGVLPAVFEEILFRGILLGGLRSFRPVYAVLLCGGLFALFHQNPAQTLYQFCCGTAFALVALKAGSVLPTMFAHFLNNALILILQKFGINAFPVHVFLAIMITSVLCLTGTLVYLLAFDKKGKSDERAQFARKSEDKSEDMAENKVKGAEEENKRERKRFFLTALVGIAVCALTWLGVLVSGM